MNSLSCADVSLRNCLLTHSPLMMAASSFGLGRRCLSFPAPSVLVALLLVNYAAKFYFWQAQPNLK